MKGSPRESVRKLRGSYAVIVGISDLSSGPSGLIVGCSKSDSRVCRPGTTQPCVCAGAVRGDQDCRSDGMFWEPCVCNGDADVDVDGDTDGDADTDNDADAEFASVSSYKAQEIEPMVACPHSPANKATARSLKGTNVERVYIGSCTGGKTTDMVAAAGLLAGRSVKAETFVVPATVQVDGELDEQKIDGKSLREIFEQAGAKIGRPSCAACLGGPIDTFGRVNEPLRCVSTTNRNFPGRMGHKEAEIFLASPMTAAATAIRGEITDPRDI